MVHAPLPPLSHDSTNPFSILVTDDDSGSRDTLAGLLKDRGFATKTASSGEEAIEIVQDQMIHLVVFDMHMPRMTGLEALQQVRLINELLPAILVTADANREVLRQAFQAHVYSVIPKPVNKSILFHTLARALLQVYGKAANELPTEDPGPNGPQP
jgi:CheY-like chemotaxis protein